MIFMCESTVFIEKNGNRTEFMKDVTKVEVTSDRIICFDILGDRRELPGGKIKVANLIDHSIILVT